MFSVPLPCRPPEKLHYFSPNISSFAPGKTFYKHNVKLNTLVSEIGEDSMDLLDLVLSVVKGEEVEFDPSDWRFTYQNEIIKKGRFPCRVPGWHTDVSMNPFNGRQDTHYIFQFGAECYTEFMTHVNVLVDMSSFETLSPVQIKQHYAKLRYGVDYFSEKLEPFALYKYDQFGIHRPTKAKETGLRTLIRVSKTTRG